ncbi:resistance to Congo red protein KNAG_0J01190 [Huiozyma naganishii CBS 8797]|uniref:Protein RCR2 n=1 Tax=Huiozyma naganishii (strain ATCC MYA-139 / BCRC 22969 / CBS 8797 / KCTC 17520 / NBRC 10181 / NCYC 3082 / Yp74L-3) TaxID=1071383 RepID=J7RBE5_HUIN7|nr:hypothetical protein KNAG_0J01190 [Kazachstania naganishii CBS 8797]CCK72200.1 hypothetical protein KNAG_0J01190 [Kazachstania naganishii CBS 8797]
MLITPTISYLLPRSSSDSSFLQGDDDPFNSSSWQWGRWVLFVIFLFAMIVLVFFTLTTNRRRRQMGRAPIRGTAWMTPPSYRQSERQYQGNSQGYVVDYVPEYSAETNENDLGYYDERGEFHPNGKTEYISPPPLEGSPDTSGAGTASPGVPLQRPDPAMLRQSMNNSDIELDFTRPTFTAQNFHEPAREETRYLETRDIDSPNVMEGSSRASSRSSQVQKDTVHVTEKVG